MSTFSNTSSETTGPIEAKFHVEPPWDGGTKVCSNGKGHMTKLAAMPNFFSPETARPIEAKFHNLP